LLHHRTAASLGSWSTVDYTMVARKRGSRRPRQEGASRGQLTVGPLPINKCENSHVKERVASADCNARTAELTEVEIVAAVESLYTDELKPFGRILRKRLSELGMDVSIGDLLIACTQCLLLSVQSENGGDWSVFRIGLAPTFVDVYSARDEYPPDLWAQLESHFDTCPGSELALPGGRYSCAQELAAMPFFAGFSLGRICHVVQLALSQKKILGYRGGAIVPYALSQTLVKEHCAKLHRAYRISEEGRVSTPSHRLPPVTWDGARTRLRELLEESAAVADVASSGRGILPLSHVKRLFRSRFGVELSETMLGYSKLSELLQDARFHDLCTVELQMHGYVVTQCAPQLTKAAPDEGGSATNTGGSISTEAGNELRCCEEPRAFEDSGKPLEVADQRGLATKWPMWSPTELDRIVKNTFINVSPLPPTPLRASAQRRSQSVPRDMGAVDVLEVARCALEAESKPAQSEGHTGDANRRLIDVGYVSPKALSPTVCTTPGPLSASSTSHGVHDIALPAESVKKEVGVNDPWEMMCCALAVDNSVTGDLIGEPADGWDWSSVECVISGVSSSTCAYRSPDSNWCSTPLNDLLGTPWLSRGDGHAFERNAACHHSDVFEGFCSRESNGIRLPFCRDEPLSLWDSGMFAEPWRTTWTEGLESMPEKAARHSTGHLTGNRVTNNFVDAAPQPMVSHDLDAMPRSRSVPRDMDYAPAETECCCISGSQSTNGGSGTTESSIESVPPPSAEILRNVLVSLSGDADILDNEICCQHAPRVRFCPDEPLPLEEAGARPVSQPELSQVDMTRLVRNTFIHAPLPLPTPLRNGSRHRSQSLPKDIGSGSRPPGVCDAIGLLPVQIAGEGRACHVDFVSAHGDQYAPCNWTPVEGIVLPSPTLTASPLDCYSDKISHMDHFAQVQPILRLSDYL